MLRRPITEDVLKELTRRIVAARPDACVVLFGSQARGDHSKHSDVDLIVVTDTDKDPFIVAGELHAALGYHEFDVDLVVMTPARFRTRRGRFDPFIHDVLAQGRVLHGTFP
jgi:predicted nucleotidyltransferase